MIELCDFRDVCDDRKKCDLKGKLYVKGGKQRSGYVSCMSYHPSKSVEDKLLAGRYVK